MRTAAAAEEQRRQTPQLRKTSAETCSSIADGAFSAARTLPHQSLHVLPTQIWLVAGISWWLALPAGLPLSCARFASARFHIAEHVAQRLVAPHTLRARAKSPRHHNACLQCVCHRWRS